MSTDYFDTEDALYDYVEKNINRLTSKTDGTNEMSRGKARAFFEASDELSELIHQELIKIIIEMELSNDFPPQFLEELRIFSSLQRKDILDTGVSHSYKFSYDFGKFQTLKSIKSHKDIALNAIYEFEFIFSSKQKALIGGYKNLYGCDSIDALGRFLMRSRLTDMLRVAIRSDLINNKDIDSKIQSGLESFYSYN
jgi:hypothetical protein